MVDEQEHTLRITFKGTIVFYRDTVAGIPLRAVIPDGVKVEFGAFGVPEREITVVPDGEEPVPPNHEIFGYVLPPHFAFIHNEQGEDITAPGIFEGWIYSGVRIEVLNATDPALSFDSDKMKDLPRIKDYVREYRYSNSVVVGGRAMGYFDIFRGQVTSRRLSDSGAFVVEVTMHTKGKPKLQITSLAAYNNPDGKYVTDVETGDELIVGNTELAETVGVDPRADFMWQLSTDQAGIPENLPKFPLGFNPVPIAADLDDLAEKVKKLLSDLRVTKNGRRVPKHKVKDMCLIDLLVSCSPSQFP